jgi:hypothetical protein
MPVTMQRKSIPFADVQFKADTPGAFRARIATLNVVDKDGDVTLPGAFPDGKSIVISAYGHTSWYGALPVGKGVIGSDQSEAWVDGEFFLNTTHGKDTYETVKALAEAGLGEWSHGYDVLDASHDPADLAAYTGASQILQKLDLFEASPVLLGAGVNTATEFVKSMTSPYSDQAEAVLATVKAWVDRSRELAALRAKEGRTLSAANRERLAALAEGLNGALTDIAELLASTEPDAGKSVDGDPELNAIWLGLQRRVTASVATV